MPPNTLAIFPAKAPVEPTSPDQGRMNDDGSDFKSFMDNATHKTDKAYKPSKESSSQNQNDIQTQKNKPDTSKPSSKTEDNSDYREVSGSIDGNPQPAPEPAPKGLPDKDNEVLSSQLQELNINQNRFEAILDLLNLNGEADTAAFLQSLSQALNLSSNNTSEKNNSADLLTKLQKNNGEAINFLKQAGLSDTEAKNLMNHLQSLKTLTNQQALNNDINDEGPDLSDQFDKNKKESESTDSFLKVAEKTDPSAKVSEKTDPFVKVTENTDPLSNKDKKINRSTSEDKLKKAIKQNEAPRITDQEPVTEKPGVVSKLGELLTEKNAQASIVQTENFSDGKNFNKGLENVKTAPDLQVQPTIATTNTAVKAVESSKPILPENLLARGATEVKIINQITDKMTVSSKGSENEVHIKLDPPSLGRVRMNIITSGDSVRTLIVAENQAVKQVIENNFNQLRDAMGEQGLKVDSFTVTVGGESNQQNSSENSSGKKDDPSAFEEAVAGDTNQNSDTETVSLFFGDNQSISVIA